MSFGTLVFGSATFAAETAGQAVDDSTIASRVKLALAENKAVDASDINVEVYKGSVQLVGFVDSESEKGAALSTARGTDGAKKVLDAMVVMPGSRTAGEVIDDTGIYTKMKTALAGVGEMIEVNTSVHKGHVILAGFVRDASIKNKADEAAKGVKGVTRIHNLIAVEP
jgi:osmotically-inducible protein OsmY